MKSKYLIQTLVASLSACLLFSCSSDKEDDIKPTPTTPQNCNLAGVTYSSSISTIMNTNCNSCHSASMASGGVTLDSYAGVRAQAVNGKLFGVITHANGFSPMPQGSSKLSDCDISKIKKWIDDGAMNH